MIVLAYLGTFAAAVFYGVATILEAISVSRMAALPNQAGIAAKLRASWLYGLGLLFDALGFFSSALALHILPLFLVESTIAASVAVTAVLAVFVLKQPLTKAEIWSVIFLVAGLALLGLTAQEGTANPVPGFVGWLFLLICLPIALLSWWCVARGRKSRWSGIVLAVISGLGFGLVGICARLVPVHSGILGWLAEPYVWAMVVMGVLAVVVYGFALDILPTTTVAALSFTFETIVPSVIGIAWLGDGVRHGLWWLAAVGFVVTLGACIRLAGRAEV